MQLTDEDFEGESMFAQKSPPVAKTSRPVATKKRPTSLHINVADEAPEMQATPLAVQDQAAGHLANINASQLPGDSSWGARDVAISKEPKETAGKIKSDTTVTDLVTITNSLMQHGEKIKWYPLTKLPGMSAATIRAMGQAIFSQYTNTEAKDIHVVSTLSNSQNDTAKIMKAISDNGHLVKDLSYDFEQSMPGYKADAKLYQYGDKQFLLVSDFVGKYVYAWEASEGKIKAPVERAAIKEKVKL
jgi:hypothetical protein